MRPDGVRAAALRAHLAAALTWLPRDAGAEPANIATHSTSSYYFYRGHGTLAGAKGSHELRASAATRWEDMPKRGRAQTTESYDLPFCKSGGRVGVKLEGVGVAAPGRGPRVTLPPPLRVPHSARTVQGDPEHSPGHRGAGQQRPPKGT